MRVLIIFILLFPGVVLAQSQLFLVPSKQPCLADCYSTLFKSNPNQKVGLFRLLPSARTTSYTLRVFNSSGAMVDSAKNSLLRVGKWSETQVNVPRGGSVLLTEYGGKGIPAFFTKPADKSVADEASDVVALEKVNVWELKQWDVYNKSFSGEAFDVQAEAVFTHEATGRVIATDLFYDGGITWSFRFTPTQEGRWSFATTSSDPDLAGHTGEFDAVSALGKTGFLTTKGSKFALQTRSERYIKPFLFNVFQNRAYSQPNTGNVGELSLEEFAENIDVYVRNAKENGMDVVFGGIIANAFYSLGALRADDHTSMDPDIETFRLLEKAIKGAYQAGGHIHFWAWGDAERDWVSPYPINGEIDKRLQRYIAARLGPLPGWSMGYGFDLEEWVTEEQVAEWASYLASKMSYPRILTSRGLNPVEMPVASHSELENSYFRALDNTFFDSTRPHFFEERDVYLRTMGMLETKRLLWQYALAGGHGGFWGYSWDRPVQPYPRPDQLRTFKRFWEKHFYFDQQPVNSALGLSGRVSVFYGEDTDVVDAPGFTGAAYAVDTDQPYLEVPVTILEGAAFLPYASDWVVVAR